VECVKDYGYWFKDGGSLRQVLIESGLVTAEQLAEISETSDGAKLGQLLVERQIMTAKELAMVIGLQLNIPCVIIGLQLNIPCVNLSTYQIEPEALQLVPESMARKYNVIPSCCSRRWQPKPERELNQR